MRQLRIADLRPWIELRLGPARGPGGQHVNKASTRVTVIFDFRGCQLLTDAERERIARRHARRLTRDGRLQVSSQQQRSQAGNRALAEARLLELVLEALRVARARRPTRPTAAARQRRLCAKRRRSEVKGYRRSKPSGDD